jgi:hypothetical protein
MDDGSGQSKGMDPAEAIQANMPWVDKTTLASIMARDLDVVYFIKLVPSKNDRKV